MGQFRNYIEDLTAGAGKEGWHATGGTAEDNHTRLARDSTIGRLRRFVSDNLEKYTVYLGERTPLEDRLAANVAAIYNNLDRV